MENLEFCSSDPRDVGPRNALFRALVAYNGSNPIRVGATLSGEEAQAGSTRWFMATGHTYVRYELRSVLPGQIVFDIGDDGDWLKARAETHALWTALNRLGIPYWGSPSGGKGIHTEVFGPPAETHPSRICARCCHGPHETRCEAETLDGHRCRCWRPDGTIQDVVDWRSQFADLVLGLAQDILAKQTGDPFISIDSDPVTIAPREGGRLVREFGSGKAKGRRKSLWHAGPGPFTPLPRTREEAYAILGKRGWPVPDSVPVSDRPMELASWFEHARTQAGCDGVCPRSIECIWSMDPWNWGGCNDCPANR